MSDSPAKSPKKWLNMLLLASLALNFFLAGLMIGGGGHDKARHGRRGPDFTLQRFARSLPEASRQVLRQTMRERRGDVRPIFEQLREHRIALHDIMQAEAFDADAARQTLAKIRTTQSDLQRPIHETIVQVAEQLTPEQRLELLEQLDRRARRGFQR